ncbi:MAG TPA: ABC transporter permease subunit [Candidatus Binatia bacterium]|nr:ABC transporter permease subunit [Candidatus Binatia bacterium]
MDRIRVVAWNAFREIRHRRITWLVLGVGVLVTLGLATPIAFFYMARTAGETRVADRIGAELVGAVSGSMAGFASILAFVLGANVISGEMRTRTIVTVLARPIERWEWVVGRWLGVQTFAVLVAAVGWVAAAALGWYLGIPLGLAFWMRQLERLVEVLFFGTVAVGLSTLLPPTLAGLVAATLYSLPALVQQYVGSPVAVQRVLASTAYFLGPAQMPDGIVGNVGREVLDPQYGLFAAVLGENLLYAATLLLLGCLVFSRREIRLG